MEEGRPKRTYKSQRAAKRFAVLAINCETAGVWASLKSICDEYKKIDPAFPSYSTLSKRRAEDENPIKFSTPAGEYSITISPLK